MKAALALAEAVYPGQLEFHDAYLQKDHYDVALVRRGDPFTRVRFGIDRDPARCRVGTACEERLRRAYASGVATGIKLKALNSALRSCGIPALGIDDTHITPAFRAIVELDLNPADQQPALDRLTPCITAFRRALPPDADPVQRALSLRILRPISGRAAEPAPLTLDTRLPGERRNEPSYLIWIGADTERASASDLRLYPHYVRGSGLDEALADVARRALAGDPPGGHVPNLSPPWGMRLDPERLDVIRTYVLACGKHEAGNGPCRTDIAVRMRYDLTSGEASEIAIMRDIRDERGSVALSDLPGR